MDQGLQAGPGFCKPGLRRCHGLFDPRCGRSTARTAPRGLAGVADGGWRVGDVEGEREDALANETVEEDLGSREAEERGELGG
jgi:hypothetical protein